MTKIFQFTLCNLLILLTVHFGYAQSEPKYNVTPGDGNGLLFWNSDAYKIHMGNISLYHYGPVTDYSIKMNMNNTAGRGWTWGVEGQEPIAALNNAGTMQLAGNMRVLGKMGIGTAAPTTSLDIRIADSGNQFDQGIFVTRGNGYLKFRNGTAHASEFSAGITGKSTTNWATSGLYIKGIPANDQSNYVGISLTAGESAPLVNADVLRIKNHTTDLVTVKSNGNVGVGTTNPGALLDVNIPITGNQFGKGVRLKRGEGYLNFRNGTASSSRFSPSIAGKATTNWASTGLNIRGMPNADLANYSGITLTAGESDPLAYADILKIKNNGVSDHYP